MKSHLIYLPKAVPHFNIKSVQRREGEKRKMKMNEIENLSINTHQHSSGYHQNSRIIMIGTTQCGRCWLAVGERNKIPLSFRRARICKFSRQKHCFLRLTKNRQFVDVKELF